VEINEKGYSFFSKKEKHSCDKKEKSEFFLILHLPGRILKKNKTGMPVIYLFTDFYIFTSVYSSMSLL